MISFVSFSFGFRSVPCLVQRGTKRSLAEKLEDESWQITSQGRDYIESGAQVTIRPKADRSRPEAEPTELSGTVPSQAELFKVIGERLGVGARKGDVKLEAIMYCVQRTADLDNLNSVWNALTEMGVANDAKKRRKKLYAQTMPDKEKELREKLETGQETGKSKVSFLSPFFHHSSLSLKILPIKLVKLRYMLAKTLIA